jgi:hypothetical protein
MTPQRRLPTIRISGLAVPQLRMCFGSNLQAIPLKADSQQIRTRVAPAAAQAEKIGEAVAREIEHLTEIPKAMAQ